MTESDNGRMRTSEEKELLGLNTDDFFIKLLIFKERLEKKLEANKNKNNE